MSEGIYTARADVRKVNGVHREATLPTEDVIEFGVHGPIKAHYRLDVDRDRPLPVDYVVAATGA
ncbi:MAG: hypothetical protein ACOC8B_04440 [Gemmatimonadota bacterium]